MNKFWGMPGPGGNLGKCAMCGDSFVGEILGHKGVESFHVDGIDEELFAHDKCIETLKSIVAGGNGEWTSLPKGPLREAFERAEAESKCKEEESDDTGPG